MQAASAVTGLGIHDLSGELYDLTASCCNSNNDLQTPKESKFIAVPLTATTSLVCEQKGSCCQWQSRCPATWSPRPTQPDTTGPSCGHRACSSPARPAPLAGPGHQPWGLRLPATVSQQTSTVAHEPGGVTFTGACWARKSHLMMPEQGPSREDCPSGGGTGRSTAAHKQMRGKTRPCFQFTRDFLYLPPDPATAQGAGELTMAPLSGEQGDDACLKS